MFVCTIYITDGISGVVERFNNVDWDQAFFAFYLALFCVLFSLGFYYLDRMTLVFNQRWRHTLSDYAVPIAVTICIAISYSVKDHVYVERIQMPRNFKPTYPYRSWYEGLHLHGGEVPKLALLCDVCGTTLKKIQTNCHLSLKVISIVTTLSLKNETYELITRASCSF